MSKNLLMAYETHSYSMHGIKPLTFIWIHLEFNETRHKLRNLCNANNNFNDFKKPISTGKFLSSFEQVKSSS